MEITLELLQKCISEFNLRQSSSYLENSDYNYKTYLDYYKGKHDILYNYAMQESRSNMKVICNFAQRFIDEEVSYTLGNSINYISTDGDKTVTDLIDLSFSPWEKLHNQELLRQALIFGEAYELQYIDSDANFKCAAFNPLSMYVLEDETVEKNVVLALQFYKKKFDDNEYMNAYTDSEIVSYIITGGILKEISRVKHNFNRVPIVVLYGNNQRKSDIEKIKSLNDSYNAVLSDAVNESGDFRNCYIKITGGAEFEAENLKEMKSRGVIQVPEDADVNFLVKNANDIFTQNLLDTLEKKIYQMASHIDTNEKLQSNTSSLALRSRLISLENKCSLHEAQLERAIRLRLRIFFEYIQKLKNKTYDYRMIKSKFTSNVPSDLAMIAQVISQLNGVISKKTSVSLLPFVENPDLELAQYQKEQIELNTDDYKTVE